MSYPWKHLNPKDGYAVRRTSFLSNVDQKVMTLLYQPLIGAKAYALFMSWWSETEMNGRGMKEGILADMLTLQSIGIPEFYDARIRLEAVGLLKTYSRKDGSYYVYEMIAPVNPEVFFEDDIYQLLLLNQVGASQFKRLKEQFLLPVWDAEPFEEITRNFTEVYNFTMDSNKKSELEQVNQSIDTQFDLKNYEFKITMDDTGFDWAFFDTNINNQFVNKKSVRQQKDVIETLHLIYGIDELKMSNYVLAASDPETGKLDANKLKTAVHNNHRPQKNVIQMQASNQPTTPEKAPAKKYSGVSSADAQLLEMSERRNPADFLISIKKQKGGFVTKVEQWTLEDIVAQSGLAIPVINILIHYILVIKNNAVFERNLAYKIANDWAQNQVSTPEKAMEKVRSMYEKKEDKPQRKYPKRNNSSGYSYPKASGRKETLPEWAKERPNQEKVTDAPLSPEDQEAFKERLKKIRSYRKEGDE